MSPKDKFISFIKGEVPIKQLFWIYGIVILNIVIPGIVYFVRGHLLLSDMQIHTLNVVTTILDLIIMVSLWNASGKESLKKSLQILLKVFIVLNLIFEAYVLYDEYKYYGDSDEVMNAKIFVELDNEELPKTDSEGFIKSEKETYKDYIVKVPYTILKDTSLIQTSKEEFITAKKNEILKEQCTAVTGSTFNELLLAGVKFEYTFKDKNGKVFAQYNIQDNDCEDFIKENYKTIFKRN